MIAPNSHGSPCLALEPLTALELPQPIVSAVGVHAALRNGHVHKCLAHRLRHLVGRASNIHMAGRSSEKIPQSWRHRRCDHAVLHVHLLAARTVCQGGAFLVQMMLNPRMSRANLGVGAVYMQTQRTFGCPGVREKAT